MPNVELPNGQIAEFPDDMSEDAIVAVIQKQFGAPKGQKVPEQPVAPTQGWQGVWEDIKGGAGDVPSALKEFITSLPSQAYQSGKQIVTHPLRAAENLGAGLLEGIKGGVNIPSNVASYLKTKGIGEGAIEDLITKAHIPDTGLEHYILGENQPGDELLRGLGSFAPYAKLGGLTKGLSGLARRGAAAGLYGAGQEENPVTAALTGLAGEGIVRGGQRYARLPQMTPNSPLSPEQLAEALRITQGTETGLGNVIDNPRLKSQFENVIANTPFSGANEAMQRTASVIKERGGDILNELKGDFDTSDIGLTLRDALKSTERETRQQKNKMFEKLNEAAADAGVMTNRSNIRQAARDELAAIQADPDLMALADKSSIKLLEELATEKGDFSLKDTDFVRGKLGKKAHDAYLANNSELGDIYGTLRDAAVKDIDDSITASNKPELNQLRDDAMDFYRKEWAPFEDKDIIKFTRKGADPDLLVQSFIRNSRLADRSKLLQKLTTKLGTDQRNLLAHSYLAERALENGEVNPLKLSTAFRQLGDRQKAALFGEDSDILSRLGDYSALVGKNTEPLTLMFNPKTGARGGSILPWAGGAAGGLAALMSGSIPTGFLTALLPVLAARPASKLLTSPSVRERIVNQLIKQKQKQTQVPKNLAPYVNALIQSSQTHKPMELELNQFAGYEGQGER